MAVDPKHVQRTFRDRFGCEPEAVVRAPGRVNIIGEHTDYNDGFVLPMAIELDTVLAGRRRSDTVMRVYATNLGETAEADLAAPRRSEETPWMDYVVGVAEEFEKMGRGLSGADIVIEGDVPLGAGLSSSASLEMATCLLFETLGGFTLAGPDAAQLGQRVENDFLGLNSGIMDQYTARMARKDHALFLDCRTLEHRLIPLRLGAAVFVIMNTNSPHRLTGSKYNERVQECRAAAVALSEALGREATHLRDFSFADVERAKPTLDPLLYKRARHVVTENERTRHACRAMEAGDATGLGLLMNASHESLQRDYEVTFDPQQDEVDLLTTLTGMAVETAGCLGARMTGGGFGGSTINLVEDSKAIQFGETILRRYHDATGIDGKVIVSRAAAGAEVVGANG